MAVILLTLALLMWGQRVEEAPSDRRDLGSALTVGPESTRGESATLVWGRCSLTSVHVLRLRIQTGRGCRNSCRPECNLTSDRKLNSSELKGALCSFIYLFIFWSRNSINLEYEWGNNTKNSKMCVFFFLFHNWVSCSPAHWEVAGSATSPQSKTQSWKRREFVYSVCFCFKFST